MSSLRDQGLCCLTYSNASSPSSRSPVTVKILSNQSANMSTNKVFLNGSKLDDSFKTRATEVGSLSARAKMSTQIFVRHIFAIFATNASFLRAIENLIQYNVQYIPCKNALLAQKHWCCPKKALFCPQVSQKVRKSQRILILRHNSVC